MSRPSQVPHVPVPPARRRRVPASVALLAALAAVAPSPASAAGPPARTPSIAPFQRALAPVEGQPFLATDEGVVAWTIDRTDEVAGRLLVDVWVLRDGSPVKVATIPDSARFGGPEHVPTGVQDLEVGTDRSGRPVAVVRTSGANEAGIDHTRIVSLVTGETRELPRTRGGLVVQGTAVDDGVLYWTITRRRPTDRSTSSLWRASLDGTTVGRSKRIRTSQRGHVWYAVIADRGRVGINATHDPRKGEEGEFTDDFSFGTPLGRWRATENLPQYAGPSGGSHGMTGFTKDGSLVTVRFRPDEDAPAYATLTPATGKRRHVLLGAGPDDVTGGLSFQASSGRFLTSGAAAGGATQVGYSAVAFAPGR